MDHYLPESVIRSEYPEENSEHFRSAPASEKDCHNSLNGSWKRTT